jgi:hypothetical protein
MLIISEGNFSKAYATDAWNFHKEIGENCTSHSLFVARPTLIDFSFRWWGGQD